MKLRIVFKVLALRIDCALRDDRDSLRWGSTFRFKLEMILQPLLLSLPPRRLNYLFCIIWGGVYYSNPGALKAPPQPSQKNHQKPKNLKAKLTVFLSASRNGFFNPIEPASRRTQESIHVHVQGHILSKWGTLMLWQGKPCGNVKVILRVDLNGQP